MKQYTKPNKDSHFLQGDGIIGLTNLTMQGLWRKLKEGYTKGCIQERTLSSFGHGVAQAKLVPASQQHYSTKASFLNNIVVKPTPRPSLNRGVA